MKNFSIISSILLVLIIMLSACSQETTISVDEEIIGDPQKTAEQEKFIEDVKTAAAGTAAALANNPEFTPTIMPTEESIIPNPMFLLSSTDCTKSNWQFSYTRSFQRVDANSSYTLTGSNGYYASENMDWMAVGQSHTSDLDVSLEGGYAANFNYKIQYIGNDGSSATLIWNCETGEVLQSSWTQAD